ncbi:MAG: hypothetical protein AB7R55_20505 [Gemmatimonadales bacterium]
MLSVTSAALPLFFVMDPLGNVPLFLSALRGVGAEQLMGMLLAVVSVEMILGGLRDYLATLREARRIAAAAHSRNPPTQQLVRRAGGPRPHPPADRRSTLVPSADHARRRTPSGRAGPDPGFAGRVSPGHDHAYRSRARGASGGPQLCTRDSG